MLTRQNQPMRVKRLAPSATVPTRGSAHAAGFDLYASREAVVPARGKFMVDTDISIALPAGTYGRVAPRSGLGESAPVESRRTTDRLHSRQALDRRGCRCH